MEHKLWVDYKQKCRVCNWHGHLVNVIWVDSPGNPGYVCTVWLCPDCGGRVTTDNWERIPRLTEKWRENQLKRMYGILWTDKPAAVRSVAKWIRDGYWCGP